MERLLPGDLTIGILISGQELEGLWPGVRVCGVRYRPAEETASFEGFVL